jgi:Na+/proline symporter
VGLAQRYNIWGALLLGGVGAAAGTGLSYLLKDTGYS